MKLLSSVSLWLRRLLILIWKNVHLRWRTSSVGCSHRLIGRVPIFLLIEVLWPLVLYTIIVLLRLNFPPGERSINLWRPVALPSAGTLPFMQSLLCDLDQNGHRYGYKAMPSYPNAPVNDVYSLLDEFGSLNGTLDTFCSTIHSLTDTTSCSLSAALPECQQDVVPLTCFLDDPTGFEMFLTSDLHFSPRLSQGILGATVDTNSGLLSGGFPLPRGKRQLPGFPSLGGLTDTLITPAGLRALVCTGNGALLNGLIEFQNVSAADVSVAVCALNTTQTNALAVELQQQLSVPTDCNPLGGLSSVTNFEKGRDLLLKFSNLSTDGLFSDTNGGGDGEGGLSLDSITKGAKFFCGDIEGGNQSLGLLLFSALYGNDYQQSTFEQGGGNLSIIPDRIAMKILYSPNNNHTAHIMTRASRTFQTFVYIEDWAQQLANCSDDFLNNFPPNSTQANNTRTLVALLLGDNSTQVSPLFQPGLDQLRQNLSVENLEYTQGLLNESAPGNIWEVVTNIRDVAITIHDVLDRFNWDVFYPMPDEASLDSLAANYTAQNELNFTTVFAGVVFDGVGEEGDITNATIKIRMNSTSVVDPTELTQTVWTPGPENTGWKKAYLSQGFSFLQDMVERALAEEIVGHPIPTPGLYLQQMPYPCYQHDNYVVAMEFMLALTMLFAWLFPVAMTTRAIVREKEVRLKEYIKMVGVSDSQLRLSRVLVSGSILLISVCFITLLLKVGNILPLTDWSLLFIYLCLYALVMLAYSFLVSTMFTNANLAACVASLIYFMVLFGHTTLVSKQQDMSPFTVGLACLWAPLGFALGAQYMVQWEVRQEGLQWANMNLLPGTDDQLSFLSVAIILCVDTALYFLATWYIEGVAPGRYGVAKPFYFPFMPSYWLGQSGRDWFKGHNEHQPLKNEDGDQTDGVGPVCEEEPLGLPLGIEMCHLTKIYSSCKRKKVTAIKDLSLNFYEGQITTLLGHNGAGKTTTLSILAGLFEPTSGTARIYGNSIRRHMDSIRQGLGICPQHNILFSELTVEEHLLFFGQLKGLSWRESMRQIPEWLSKVDLLPHATKLAKHLSGGMKRKLSILLAFVGGSRTVILDEPTAGVDPYARRQIWDFLLRQREGRTIILSTHHMDEAEILGDRIAIISQGSLICCGSFEFLKHRFGQGHRLTLLTTSSEGACEEGVGAFLVGHVRGVKLLEVRGPELHYLLPLSGARASVLTQLFRELEAAKAELGVVSYGLTACSMEEIFVELTEKDEKKSDEDGLVPRPSVSSIETTPPDNQDDLPDDTVFDESPLFGERQGKLDRLSRAPLWFSQYTALMAKRFHYTKRRLLALVIQNILPLFVLGMSLLIAHLLQTVPDPPPIELTPNLLFSINKNNYLFAAGYSNNQTDKYIQTLFQPCGVGGHSTSADPSKCFPDNSYNASSAYLCPDPPLHSALCTCSANCSSPVPFPPQPSCYNGTGTGSRVQNLTMSFDPNDPNAGDETITNYLLQSKQSFVQQRYGGLSFGLVRSEVDESLDPETIPFLAVREAAKVWYSLKSYHSQPSFINVMNNALMRGELGPDKQQSQYGFKTISHPFPTSDLWKINYAIKEKGSFLVNPLALMFALGFVVAGFVLILIEERAGNVKHLQLICGMNKTVYWLANFTWDLLWFVGFTLLTLALYLAFQDPFYTGSDVLPLFLLVLLAYGLAVTPWIYVMSFLFQSPATAYVVLFCLNFLGGFSILIVDAILLFVNTDSDQLTKNHLYYWLGLIPIPSYVLARGSMYIASDYPLRKVVASFGAIDLPNPYAELAPFLAALLGQAIFYTAILVLIEMRPYLRGIICRGRSKVVTSLPLPLDSDDDVRAERSKVTAEEGDSEILRMNALSRVYRTNLGRSRRVAVNQLCLSVNKGECFGLLGVNGAGKTTTFKMLTGDIVPSAGDAVIAGHTLSTSRGPVQQSIGYCPQVDALIDQLTGRQHLVLFCRLRGLRGTDLQGVVEEALEKLGLNAYADRPVGAYSGGNRRKLSTAIALLANPPLVLLDEPTSGVDPRARHFLWSLIRRLVADSTQSVVLTTHSMAECEALCSRVAIMVNGEFHCLGSPQQLKSTYGSGYKLKLRVAGEVEPVKEFVRQNLPGAVLKEEHYTTLVYQLLSSDSLLLHNVLEIMEQARETLDIQDYSVSQTTLDDVFIHFANEQSEEVGIMRGEVPNGEMLPDLVPLGPVEHVIQITDDDQATQL